MEPSVVQAALDDTQAALSAALAKIEAFRRRERRLVNELSQLRQQVHGEQISQAKAAVKAAASGNEQATQTVHSNEPAAEAGGSGGEELQSTTGMALPQVKEPAFTTINGDEPLYISSITGSEHPVAVWLPGDNGLERINCQLIVDKEYIDFVQLRVRVKSEDFIGITSVKESKPKGGDETDPGPTSESGTAARGRYRIYLRGREQRSVEFDASQTTRATLHKHTQRWLGQDDETGDEALKEAGAEGISGMAAPRHMVPGPPPMQLVGDTSHILGPGDIAALSSVVPPLERMRDWGLSYSTKVHGISLATLYRKVHGGTAPTLLVIKDNSGHVFGCYTPEGWRLSPRYYGSGETFVFQLEPARVMWPWLAGSHVKNDFFQYSTPECLALGGTGHFALHVDEELLQGSSGACGTFGSPCLAGGEEFKVVCLEVWQVVT